MDSPNTIYLTAEKKGNWSLEQLAAVTKIKCLPNRLAIVKDGADVSEGGILLPLSGRMSADTGHCVSGELEGHRVAVLAGHGLHIDDWKGLGHNLIFLGVSCPWYESVPCILDKGTIKPTYDWILIERIAKVTSSLALPEGIQPYDRYLGIVQGFGPMVNDLTVLDTVVFDSRDIVDFKFDSSVEESLCLVRKEKVWAVKE